MSRSISTLALLAGAALTVGFPSLVPAQQEQGVAKPPAANAAKTTAEAVAKTTAEFSALGRLLPLGLPQKNVKLPEFEKAPGGGVALQLASLVKAETMTRKDDRHIDLDQLVLTRFGENRSLVFELTLKTGAYDLKTGRLSSKERSLIVSPDFMMQGDSLLFDSGTRQGRMEGNVVMTVFNSDSLGGPVADEEPSAIPALPGPQPATTASVPTPASATSDASTAGDTPISTTPVSPETNPPTEP